MSIRPKFKFWIIFFLLLLAAVLFFKFFVKLKYVDVGFIGVKSDVRAVNDSTSYKCSLVKGYVVFLPMMTKLQLFPTTVQSKTFDPYDAKTKDGVSFKFHSTLSYQLIESKLPFFYKAYQSELTQLEDQELKNLVKEVCFKEVGCFTSDSLIENRKAMDEIIEQKLTEELDKMGLKFIRITNEIDYPQTLMTIIEERSKAVQNAIVTESMKRQQEAEAVLKVIDAEAIRKADSLKNSALTLFSNQKLFIEKWDGKLPVYGTVPQMFKQVVE